MKTLVHNSPVGALSIAGVPGDIEPGQPFDVDDAVAALLLEQSDLFQLAVPATEPGPYDALKLAELKDLALERGITVDGKTKVAHAAALTAADQTTNTEQLALDEPPADGADQRAGDDTTGDNA